MAYTPLMSSYSLNRPRTSAYSTLSGGMSSGGVSIPAGTPLVNTRYSTPGTYNTVSKTYNASLGPVLGSATSTSAGSGSGSGLSNIGNNNPQPQVQAPQESDWERMQREAAQAQYEADVAAENTLWERQKGEAEAQKTELGQTESKYLSDIAQQQADLGKTATGKKKESTELTEQEIAKAGSSARENQNRIRNMLRAMGILGSTYALDKLAAPISAFQDESARLTGINLQNASKVDEWFAENENKLKLQENELKQNFVNLRAQIDRDMRFGEGDKLAAIKAANAALAQNLSSIAQQKVALAQNYQATRNSMISTIANAYLSQNPQADISKIMNTAATLTNQYVYPTSQTAAIYDPNKKYLSGQV